MIENIVNGLLVGARLSYHIVNHAVSYDILIVCFILEYRHRKYKKSELERKEKIKL